MGKFCYSNGNESPHSRCHMYSPGGADEYPHGYLLVIELTRVCPPPKNDISIGSPVDAAFMAATNRDRPRHIVTFAATARFQHCLCRIKCARLYLNLLTPGIIRGACHGLSTLVLTVQAVFLLGHGNTDTNSQMRLKMPHLGPMPADMTGRMCVPIGLSVYTT